MPTDTVDLTARIYPIPGMRLARETQEALLYGSPMERYGVEGSDYLTTDVGWGRGIAAQYNIFGGRAFFESGYRSSNVSNLINEQFNPWKAIQDNPEWRDDPHIAYMAERGQFDQSFNKEQFEYDIERGRRYLKDLEDYSHLTWKQWTVGLAFAMVADPINLLPYGVAFKVAKTGTRMIRIAKMASVTGGITVMLEKLQNELQPVSDEPGLSNEAAAFAVGAGLGTLIGTAGVAFPSARGRLGVHFNSRRIRQVEADVARMSNEPQFKSFAPDADDALYPLKEAIDNDRRWLRQILEEDDVTPGRPIKVLDTPENRALLDEIDALYKQTEVDPPMRGQHPEQYIYDNLTILNELSESSLLREATAKDLDVGLAKAKLYQFGEAYAKVQSIVNPGGRLAKSGLARVQKVIRTANGSLATHTVGARADALNYVSGAPAESLADMYRGFMKQTTWNLRRVFTAAKGQLRKTGGRGFNYDGKEVPLGFGGYTRFRETVYELMAARQAKHRYPDVQIPTDVHPAITEAADTLKKYWNESLERQELAGAIKLGPRRVREMTLAQIRRQAEIQELRALTTSRAEQVAEVLEAPSYSIASLDKRMKAIEATMPENSMTVIDHITEARAWDITGDLSLSLDLVDAAKFPIHPDEWRNMTAQQQFAAKQTAGTYGKSIIANEDVLQEMVDLVGSRTYDQALDLILTGRARSRLDMAERIMRDPNGPFSPDQVLDAQLYYLSQTGPPTRLRTRLNKKTGKLEEVETKAVPRDAVDPMDIPEGAHFTVFGEDATVLVDPIDGRVLEIGDVRYGIDELDTIPVERDSIRDLDIPTKSSHRTEQARAQAKIRRLEKRHVIEAENLRKASEKLEEMKDYLPTVYDVEAMLANKPAFLVVAAREFRDHDGIVDGVRVADEARPVLSRPLLDKGVTNDAAIREAHTRKTAAPAVGEEAAPAELPLEDIIKDLTELDLPPDVLERYHMKLDEYYRGAAGNAYDTITHAEMRHGVAAAIGNQNAIKRRVMTVNYQNLREFLVKDPEVLLARYDRVAMGQAALRRSIKLNPQIWDGVTLRDGSAIETGSDMLQYVNEFTDAMETVANMADRKLGRTGAKALAPKMQAMKGRIAADLEIPIRLIEGKTPVGAETPIYRAASYFGRLLLPLGYANKLGSVAWSLLNDLAPKTMYLMQNPRTIAMIPRVIRGLMPGQKSIHLGAWQELQAMGIGFDNMCRINSLVDLDNMPQTYGFGTGTTKRITGRIQDATGRIADFSGRASMMNFFTDASKQLDGVIMLHRTLKLGRKLYKANLMAEGGTSLPDALKKVRIHSYDAERMNHMGFDAPRLRRYMQLVYQHGLTPDDKAVRTQMSFAEFIESRKMVKPNYIEWKLRARDDVDMFEILMANMNREVNRFLTVTPGKFDMPLLNSRLPVFGKLFNQFQTFGMAFANQRIRPMSQMPLRYQAWYVMWYMQLGAVSDAIAAHLGGRRTFSETAELWERQPLSMMMVAAERSGMLGWLNRPWAALQGLGLDVTQYRDMTGTSAARHVQPGKVWTYLGPGFNDIDRGVNVGFDMVNMVLSGVPADSNTAYNAWKLTPFQNWVGFRLLHKTTGLPVVPEVLMEERWKDLPARP